MEAEANVEWNYKFLLKYTECQAVMKKDFSCSWIIYFHNFLFAVHLNKRGPPCFCNKAQLHKKKSNFISAIIFCSWLVYFHKVHISTYTPTKGGPSIHSEQSWITQKVSKEKCSILKLKERFENWEGFVKEFKLPELLRHINKCLGWKRLTKIKNFGRC